MKIETCPFKGRIQQTARDSQTSSNYSTNIKDGTIRDCVKCSESLAIDDYDVAEDRHTGAVL